MLRKEWKGLVHNKLLLVVVVAIVLIPTIYTTLFLGSMWDPYGNLDKLPVAVVNEDKAVSYNDRELNVGEELTDKLREEESLCFNFVDAETKLQIKQKKTKSMLYSIFKTLPANTFNDINLYDFPKLSYYNKLSHTFHRSLQPCFQCAVPKFAWL